MCFGCDAVKLKSITEKIMSLFIRPCFWTILMRFNIFGGDFGARTSLVHLLSLHVKNTLHKNN